MRRRAQIFVAFSLAFVTNAEGIEETRRRAQSNIEFRTTETDHVTKSAEKSNGWVARKAVKVQTDSTQSKKSGVNRNISNFEIVYSRKLIGDLSVL